MAVQLGIEDFAYFIFHFAVQFYWWGGLFSVWEGVQEGRFELGDMENRVDPLELLQEADCNRVHAWGIILNGPRFFSASFLEGWVVQKNFAFTYTWSPILKAGDSICWQSAA